MQIDRQKNWSQYFPQVCFIMWTLKFLFVVNLMSHTLYRNTALDHQMTYNSSCTMWNVDQYSWSVASSHVAVTSAQSGTYLNQNGWIDSLNLLNVILIYFCHVMYTSWLNSSAEHSLSVAISRYGQTPGHICARCNKNARKVTMTFPFDSPCPTKY